MSHINDQDRPTAQEKRRCFRTACLAECQAFPPAGGNAPLLLLDRQDLGGLADLGQRVFGRLVARVTHGLNAIFPCLTEVGLVPDNTGTFCQMSRSH